MRGVFGGSVAASVASDQVMSTLGGRSAEQALADGEDPGVVWDALCEHMGIDEERRHLEGVLPSKSGKRD